ncbi:MAG: hypothetical protein M1153_00345, partial [Patescibacteria group bacterium]|nr:hypothetical protein [Patescibacteria group bacterium]
TNYAMGAIIGGHNGCSSQYTAINLNGHVDTTCGNYYNILSGTTDENLYFNSPLGTDIYFRTNNANDAYVNNTGMGVYETLTAGVGMAGGTDEFHVINTTGNAYLYAYSTAGASATLGAWSGGGAVPLNLGGSIVSLPSGGIQFFDGTTQTTAYQPQATTVSFSGYGISSNSLNYYPPAQLLASASITTTKINPLHLSVWCQYVEGDMSGDGGTLNLELNGVTEASTTWYYPYDGGYASGCNFSTIIPNVSAGTNTLDVYASLFVGNGGVGGSPYTSSIGPGGISIASL